MKGKRGTGRTSRLHNPLGVPGSVSEREVPECPRYRVSTPESCTSSESRSDTPSRVFHHTGVQDTNGNETRDEGWGRVGRDEDTTVTRSPDHRTSREGPGGEPGSLSRGRLGRWSARVWGLRGNFTQGRLRIQLHSGTPRVSHWNKSPSQKCLQ